MLRCRFKRTQFGEKVPEGRLARFHKPVLTAEQREATDVAAAERHFVSLGWEPSEVLDFLAAYYWEYSGRLIFFTLTCMPGTVHSRMC